MNLAIGRLYVTVSLAPPARRATNPPHAGAVPATAERAYQRQRAIDCAEEERRTWERLRQLNAPTRPL